MEDAAKVGPSVAVRHEPVQARAAQRVEELLDAAAAVVDEHGIEHLTTALVAERAGASIGTVYRYFPDRVAVLVALATRNLERMRLSVERVAAQEHETWADALEAMAEAFVETFRTVPSFRSLRTGNTLDLGPDRLESSTPILVDDVVLMLEHRWGMQLDDAQREAVDTAIGVLDALVCYAFTHDPHGEQRYLDLAVRHAREALYEALPDPR